MLTRHGVHLVVLMLVGLCAALLLMLAAHEEAGAAGKKDFPGFRGRCYFDQRAVVDPIAKTHHLHEFFGAKGVTNDSTYKDLRASETTCNRLDDKSAYWMPTIRWGGEELAPTRSGFYFQTLDGLDPLKTRPFPEGLKMIAGEGPGRQGGVFWICDMQASRPVSEDPPESCLDPSKGFGLKIVFPECWDGEKRGADNEHSVVEAVKRKDGSRSCPAHHPIQLPTLTIWPDYPALPSESGEVTVSMGDGEWGGPESMHADAFIGFDTTLLVRKCIKKPALGYERPWACNADRFDN